MPQERFNLGMNMKRFFSTLKLIVLLMCVGCQSSAVPVATASAIPVKVIEVAVKDIVSHLEVLGTLEAALIFEVRPQVAGLIEEIYIEEGAWVQKGQPLFKLDSRSYINQLHQAEAQLAVDMVAFKLASQKVERQRRLAAKDLISQIEWESTQAAADAAEAQLKLDRARVAAAELDVENCTLKAVSAGRVGKLHVYPGALVTAAQSQPLVIISAMHPLMVEFAVSEKELAQLDKKIDIVLQSLCMLSSPVSGKICFIDNAFDDKSGQIAIRAEVPNEGLCLRPGQSVRVQIATKIRPQKMVIPQKAVKYDAAGPYVYIVDADQKAELRYLVLGEEDQDEVIVEEGVNVGDKVVTTGHLRLFATAKVEIKS